MIGQDHYKFCRGIKDHYWKYQTKRNEEWRYIQDDSVQDKILDFSLSYLGHSYDKE
ncbi:hypothetical protein HMPREF0908_0898 [Selenomonas flueggei ATCC 43531]|uniref:Uncharacterized protein n=1 Tax=Selenomonas flueggei ATCC 43531 TaxID=638302 RepID=C4V2S8_9FIRM|nr:hypothetical protein HMPREF0908_0898 [Selenomonas flueggei ATCC 43531]